MGRGQGWVPGQGTRVTAGPWAPSLGWHSQEAGNLSAASLVVFPQLRAMKAVVFKENTFQSLDVGMVALPENAAIPALL